MRKVTTYFPNEGYIFVNGLQRFCHIKSAIYTTRIVHCEERIA